MTRIVIDPDQLHRVAGFMTEAADDYSHRARQLRSRALPPMPASVAANVEEGVASVSRSLEEGAARLDAEAMLLRLRAAIFSGDNGRFAVEGLNSFARSLETSTD